MNTFTMTSPMTSTDLQDGLSRGEGQRLGRGDGARLGVDREHVQGRGQQAVGQLGVDARVSVGGRHCHHRLVGPGLFCQGHLGGGIMFRQHSNIETMMIWSMEINSSDILTN